MSDRTGGSPEIPTAKLVEAALHEGRELIKLELQLAKLEAKKQLKDSVKAAIGFVIAASFMVMGLVLLVVALVLALGGTALSALGVAIGAFVLGGGVALIAWSAMPHEPLEHSRHHLSDDFKQLKEHVS